MARFDRYMLSQLLVLFGFFSLVLVAVIWINQAVILFDSLIADGQPVSVFLELTALSLPSVIRTVLPLSAFAATIYVTNRMSQESELIVMQATGYSPWRLARPVLTFGCIVGAFMMALTQYLVPSSMEQLREREAEISGSLSAQLLREGEFMTPSEGVTFYIREITPEGVLKDLFLSDQRKSDRGTVYTSIDGFLVKDDSGPKLVMVNGVAQTLNSKEQTLTRTNFKDFSYDISALLGAPESLYKPLDQRSTAELIWATDFVVETTGATKGRVLEELHMRFNQPLLCIVATLIAFAALLTGGFSRFGIGRQIFMAIFLLIVLRLVESFVTDPVRSSPALWPLVYLQTVFGLAIAGGLLHAAAKPKRRRREKSSAALESAA